MIFVNHFSPIRSLANDIDTPILWTPEQRKWLEGSSMSTLVAMLDRQNDTDWVTLIQPVLSQYGPVGDTCTKADYLWAQANIWSRAFCYSSDRADSGEPQVCSVIVSCILIQFRCISVLNMCA